MVSPVATPSTGLDGLLARPPTPPRERQNDIDPKSTLGRHPLASRISLQTPPGHSPSSALSTNGSSRRSRKRVEFTVPAERRDPPADTDQENEHRKSTPIAAASPLGLSKPLKSILKHTSSPIPPNPLDPSATDGDTTNTTFATMLESAIKHLAGNDRDSKVDAYTVLVRALKASTNLPDRIALQSKMGLFMQFIQRDITAKGENGAIDSSLIKHSLTLLSTFLRFPAIAMTVAPDFGVFIIDHCIRSFEDPSIPKDVVRHLMQVVGSQDFPPKVMTADRVGRLVASLHNMEDHIKGKSIIMSRILIYRTLIRQSTIHMVTHSEWLRDLFTDMLSSLKEIRSEAIALGLEASFTAAKEKQLSRKVMDLLQMSADETKYAEYYVQRLTAMTQEKSEMAAVPRIWSVVVLLLRCPLDRWEFFQPWLRIIQRCFNSGDYQTKLEAIFAWNRLVYALHLHESSFSKSVNVLCEPLSSLMRRSKQSDDLRKVVMGGICNLYYYAFKPGSSSIRIDQYWDACVGTLMRMPFPDADRKLPEKQQVPSDSLSQTANILTGLFDSSTIRIWKEDRIAENAMVKHTELPALDPKWIRRNSARVFSVVEPIIVKLFLDLVDSESSVSKLWRSLVGAVAVAASKEVKVATDTVGFLGSALGLLLRIWTTGLDEATISTDADAQRGFLKATESYLTTMILSIGHLSFTEKRLLMNQEKTLVPVATPSRRSGKGHGATRSPLCHLFSILSFLPPGISDGDDVSGLFKAIFEPFVLSRSPRGKKDLARELIQVSPLDSPVNVGPWILIAEILSSPADSSQPGSQSADSASQSPTGHEFRDIVRHLEKGINHTSHLPWSRWLSLFHSAIGQATEFSGEAGCSIAIIEPLAKALLDGSSSEAISISSNLYKCGVQLICNARQPRDRQALDAAKRRLWGTTVAGVRSVSFDPFDNLYRLTSHLLGESYKTVDNLDESVIACLITEISHFLSRSNRALVFKSLGQLQQGLGVWIQDTDERYGSKQHVIVSQAIILLFDQICNLFSETMLEHFQLDAIEQLLCYIFTSKHRHIVNNMTLLWNRAFDNVSEISYPEALKDVLLSLRQHVDIVLPGLEASAYHVNELQSRFVDSQDDMDVTTFSAKLGQQTVSAPKLPSSPIRLPLPRLAKTPESARTKSQDNRGHSRSRSAISTRSAKRSRASKLRHDDSQIQFAPIEEPSPSHRGVESQVLTDRQKEVRERQLENTTLFPSIRSSPEKEGERLTLASNQHSPHPSNVSNVIPSSVDDKSATPKATRSYNYISSTPTPRRGQQSIIDEDHEMTDDVPSSPPEPRRYLLPEMRSHSRETRMIDDMPISSSPISGSPISNIRLRPQNDQRVSREVTVNAATEPVLNQHTGPSTDAPLNNRPYHLLVNSKENATPSPHTTIYVDTPENTVQQLPARDNASVPLHSPADGREFNNRSFEMSDGEERSMARLVIELDSRKCDPLPIYETASPERVAEGKDTLECITVETGPGRVGDHLGWRQNNQSAPLAMPTPASPDNSQPSVKSLKKRKQAPDTSQNINGKRRKNDVEIGRRDPNVKVEYQVSEQPPLVLGLGLNEANGTLEEGGLGNKVSLLHMQGSPDLSCNPGSQSPLEPLNLDEDSIDSDTAAVNLQLITEASQQSEADNPTYSTDDDISKSLTPTEAKVISWDNERLSEIDRSASKPLESTTHRTAPQAAHSVVEKIKASLQDGLEGLRTATLSREDVYKIEDMFMDIKKELYEAERRSRR